MNPKTIFISAFILFASALCLQAQGTYEYATVSYTRDGRSFFIGVSTSNNYTETAAKSKFDAKGPFSDLTPLLEKVNEMAKEGWEVFSTSEIPFPGTGYGLDYLTYHLRRKKP